jgi:glycerol kinase
MVRAIPAVSVAVAADLAADRGRRAPELQRDPTDRRLRGQQIRDPDPLVLREIPRTSRPHVLETSLGAIRGALDDGGSAWRDVAAVGIANQEETTIAWDARTGRAVGPALSWQGRRTTAYCAELVDAGHEPLVRGRTGLPIDPCFSASKIRWLLDASEPAHDALARGTLRVGGSDAFVMFRLTGDEVHATDPSTAARTALMDLALRSWDPEIANDVFGIPVDVLPEIRPSAGAHFGAIRSEHGPIPITADVVDANAALFAQGCFAPQIVKATYGTGAFVAVSAGPAPVIPTNGLLPFVGRQLGDDVSYSVEDGVFDVGTAIDWLMRTGLLEKAQATERVGADACDVIMIPSFTGLAAPRWKPRARAAFLGMTLDTTPDQLVRAALEGIACSVADIVGAMEDATGVAPTEVRVDGGPTRNTLLMQLQADLLGWPVAAAREADLTAFGAALLAGVGAGVMTLGDVATVWGPWVVFEPRLGEDERLARMDAWHAAVDAVAAYSEVTIDLPPR